MSGDAVYPLDTIRSFRILVWKAVNRGLPLRTDGLEDFFRSFGLEVPLCELHRKAPDLKLVLQYLELLETSLMGVS